MNMNCVRVDVSARRAPQVLLPLKKWEAAWLGWLSAVPVPKATFLKGLCGTWGFNSVILPKNAGKKPHKLLHCLGRSHGGIPAGLPVTQAENRPRKGLSFWDTLQFLNQAAGTVASFLYSGRGRHLDQRQRDLSWYLSAWIPAHSCNMLTCPSALKHSYFIFESASTGCLPRQSKANKIRSLPKDTHLSEAYIAASLY